MTDIIHNPYGQEHPYEQLPEERFPRRPLAGERFTIGIVTRPPGAVQHLRVCSQLDGSEQAAVEAQRIADWQPSHEEGVGAEYLERRIVIDQDVWQAQLVAPDLGQTLHYWLEAEGQRSERFELVGETWQSGGGLSIDGDGLMTVSAQQTSTAETQPLVQQIAWLTDGQTARRLRLVFQTEPDEGFFGLGERFNALDQRGQILDVRCFEQYKNQGKRSYMPLPFLLSSQGYAVWVQSSRWMQFDLAASDELAWILEADLGPEETLTMQWFRDEDPFTMIGQFASRSGPVTLPPEWTFGLWMSSNEWNSQTRVVAEVEASLAQDIAPAVLVIEAWSDETTFYIWNDAQYTPTSGDQMPRYGDFSFPEDGKWRDPKGMVDWLHEQGIKVLLWQVPVLKQAEAAHPQHDADRAYYEAAGFGVREADGSLHRVRPFWFRGGYLWDVTNPDERDWWLNKRGYLLDEVGIDGFKTDGGEHLWSEQVVFADGRRGAEVWNEYPQRYTEAYYQFANQRREAITFSRAGFTGSQRAPLHWAGDENSSWAAFRHSILAGLSAGISGIPFWGWDFGGFSGEIPDADLYLRAAAMAVFCPVMQYHSEFNAHRQPSNDRSPWNIQARTGDETVIPTFRSLVNLRHNLMPYIWQEAQYSAQTGQPMMRALALTEPQASPYQYMFGRDLLVSPVVEPTVTDWTVYLPAGNWYSLWDQQPTAGGQTVSLAVPHNRAPVFVRAGSAIPLHLGDSRALGDVVPLNTAANHILTMP